MLVNPLSCHQNAFNAEFLLGNSSIFKFSGRIYVKYNFTVGIYFCKNLSFQTKSWRHFIHIAACVFPLTLLQIFHTMYTVRIPNNLLPSLNQTRTNMCSALMMYVEIAEWTIIKYISVCCTQTTQYVVLFFSRHSYQWRYSNTTGITIMLVIMKDILKPC